MTKLKNTLALAAGIVTLLGQATVNADTITMNDGQQQTGLINKAKSNGRLLTIRTTSGEISIPRNKISRIEETSVATSYGQLGDAYLKSGNFEKAIESFEAGLGAEAGNLDLKQKLMQAKGGVSSVNSEAQSAMDDRAQRTMGQARKLADSGNFDQAYNTMKSIEPSELSPLYPAYQQAMADLYVKWGTSLLDRQNTGGAAEKLSEALKIDPANARAKELLVKTFAGDPTKLEESAAFYLQSENAEEQLKGADALFKLQKYEQAAPVYQKYIGDSTLEKQYNITQRLITIYDTLSSQAASRSDYQNALQYFKLYYQLKPDADPTPASKYLFMIKRQETDMNSPDSRFALANFAEQLGLIPTAKEEYRNILAMDSNSTSALAALRKFAESDIADARDFMAQGQYTLAVQMAQGVVESYPMYPDLITLANQMQAQAQVEAQKEGQMQKANARALAERGDSYYNQAMQNLAAYASNETNQNIRAFSPRNEAAKYLGQALFAWKTALKMDPALGDPTTYNLNFKIQDATNKYAALANRRAPVLPRANRFN